MTFTSNERATSTTVNYVLLLGIVTVLVAVLLVSTANVVEGEQERAVEAGLTVVGNDLAAELESTSTLATSIDESSDVVSDGVTRHVELPDEVAGATYSIEIDPTTESIKLWTTNPYVVTEVSYNTHGGIDVGDVTTLNGADVRLVYVNDGDGSMEVING